MSYIQLELENCILLAPSSDSYATATVGGLRIEYGELRWFQIPFFVASLPENTWGALSTYVCDNIRELQELGYPTNGHVRDLVSIPENMLDKPILSASHSWGSETTSTSVLFPLVVPTQPQKPYRAYDGINSQPTFPLTGRRGSAFCSTYHSSRCDELEAERGGVPPYESNSAVSQVMNYSYTPEFNFMTMGKEKSQCFFGMELEVNTKLPWNDIYRTMTEVHPIQEAFVYAKQDSSISGQHRNSYELVTHPMTPRRMRLEWKRLFKKLETLVKERGLVWEETFDMTTTTTGLHVHVSKTAFHGLSRTHKKKFMLIWNNNAKSISDFTSQLSGRKLTESSYCRPSGTYKSRTLAWMLREGKNSDRNSACNETPNTVEVRAFKGTPSLKCVLRAVDTTAALIAFTEQAPISQFNRDLPSAFQSWLKVTPPNSYRALKESLLCVS